MPDAPIEEPPPADVEGAAGFAAKAYETNIAETATESIGARI
jgi:hypothetical protein